MHRHRMLSMSIPQPESFGSMPDGTAVDVFTLTNSRGLRMRVMTYGAVVLSLEAPDRAGALVDVVLGHSTLAAHLRDASFHGTVAGRYANRIAQGRFTLDGVDYCLATNN